jgi:hypothetical protein
VSALHFRCTKNEVAGSSSKTNTDETPEQKVEKEVSGPTTLEVSGPIVRDVQLAT